MDSAICEPAGPIDEESRGREEANTAAYRAEIIHRLAGQGRLDESLTSYHGRLVEQCGRAVLRHPLDIRLDTDEPDIGKLVIVADLTAPNKGGGLRRNVCRCESSGRYVVDRLPGSRLAVAVLTLLL